MKTIHLLSDHLISQIAAGEVIERPAFAVKELVENALDANASRISVELTESGFSKIIVTDNGIGMTKEDLLESYKLHTTSKVRDELSLLSIKSLGFRGEALASIAAFSTIIIESKTEQETIGTKIEVSLGKLISTSSVGMPTGTRVIVERLFSDVPARKKFLKSKTTELRYMIDILVAQAIAHPTVHFHISHEGKTLLSLPPGELSERLRTLFGSELTDALFPVDLSDAYGTITGFIGHPNLASTILPKQQLVINSRPVTDKLIQLAIKETYGLLIEHDAQPSWFLALSLPFEMIDVNIHPRKEQVRFTDQRMLYDLVSQAVRATLESHNITFYSSAVPNEKITQTILGKTLKDSVIPWNTDLLTGNKTEKIIQLNNIYILVPTSVGLTIIDQHAAHERILYEKFKTTFLEKKTQIDSMSLPTPLLLQLSVSEALTLEESKPDLESWGFRIEHFSGNTFNISNVPAVFGDRDIRELLMELMHHFSEESFLPNIDTQTKKLLAYLACRTAVKAGQPLTGNQMRDIITELGKNPDAVTCPHGRPIRITIPLSQLHKEFKRT